MHIPETVRSHGLRYRDLKLKPRYLTGVDATNLEEMVTGSEYALRSGRQGGSQWTGAS